MKFKNLREAAFRAEFEALLARYGATLSMRDVRRGLFDQDLIFDRPDMKIEVILDSTFNPDGTINEVYEQFNLY